VCVAATQTDDDLDDDGTFGVLMTAMLLLFYSVPALADRLLPVRM
jgi:hypothetical protein